MRKVSHKIWGLSKAIAPTTWGTDWDNCGTANHVLIILDFSSCHDHEASIVILYDSLKMFRLIILLNILGKLIEKVIGERLQY